VLGVDEGEEGTLRRYLDAGHEALLWKLEGASDYDVRRPVTPTGTNLLGLVKHVASVEAGYLGETFGRPFPEPLPWFDDDAEPEADLWAAPDESRADVLGLHRRVRAHAGATLDALDLSAPGRVPHWPEPRCRVTLHQVLVHLIAEVQRHAGHADIVRELVDGSAGMQRGNDNLADVDAAWRAAHVERLQRTAEGFR
jgi:hypothetical protein